MHTIEHRKVSDAVWWKPWTWKRHHFEKRRVWDMDVPMDKAEVSLFLDDNCQPYSVWERDHD